MSEKTSISRRRYLKYVGAGAVVAAAAAAGGYYYSGQMLGAPPTVAEKKPIRVGFPCPLTGYLARDGEEQRRGFLIAVDEINSSGGLLGRPVEIVTTDVENYEPEKVIAGFNYLFQNKVVALLTGYPGIGMEQGEYDVVAKAGIPYLHSNTLKSHQDYCIQHPDTTWGIFQMDCSTDTYAYNYVDLLNTLIQSGKITPKKNNLAIVTSEDVLYIQLGKWVAEMLQKQGWDVPMLETVPMGTTEWGPTLSKIRGINPAAIMFNTYVASDAAAFVKQWRENPTNSLMYIHYVPSVPEFFDLTGDAANGIVWATNCGLLPNERGDKFVKSYQKMWGATEYPSIWSCPTMYDTVMLWAEAVKSVGNPEDYRAVAKAMEDTKFNGVNGPYKFDPKRHEPYEYPVDAKMQYDTGNPTNRGRGLPMQNRVIVNGENKLFMYPAWSSDEATALGITPDMLYQTVEFQKPPWLT